ncbi:anti-sigma B factor antagonist [Pseudoxanthomonas broegbernensis]|uniref:Anti-sigma B factor antagonist n=1 Tax=Pseudoxanthomonas broegbernensis TaxID=83619 RepID=A0A7V8K7S7_9GAMM|nr:STAS domain-containing protein [Pseudoxanthomonas broegbernensis]KAF1686869.1 anti-sigma B factor antagonist [Pseudoxanthomonas broegbernensis]MBB6065541.1 phospholipid transport system transporter-binding protein [Pseudoxanthomonas broegbernensis]
MATPEPAALRRDGAVLHVEGHLDRAAVPALWRAAQPLPAGVEALDLSGVRSLDSAGLALLAELAARIAAAGTRPRVAGEPPGLAELCAAYRMDPNLDYAGATR